MYNQFNGVIRKYRNDVKKRLDVDECASCHQLRKKENLKLTNSKTDLIQLENIYFPCFICKGYCFPSIKINSIPSFTAEITAENNMHSEIPPESISVLNIFERSLIQFGKCFQTIIKLKPLKYNPKSYSDFVPAMKGIAIHLPLLCEAIHDHVRDTLPSAEKLNILIDSIPTKEKKI
jgi:hypothetical protein